MIGLQHADLAELIPQITSCFNNSLIEAVSDSEMINYVAASEDRVEREEFLVMMMKIIMSQADTNTFLMRQDALLEDWKNEF